MTSFKEILPCPLHHAPNLCLIHGWGGQNAIWRDWAETYLSPHFSVHLIELPGHGNSPALPHSKALLQDWSSYLRTALPAQTHLLGWSLGGLLAQHLTQQAPQQIQSLTCLASTPRFTQSENWTPAVNPAIFKDFALALKTAPTKLLKQFTRLQLHGAENERSLMKALTAKMKDCPTPNIIALEQGLELLQTLDFREQMTQTLYPTLWLLGEKDPLIPVELAEQLEKSQIQHSVINGASHTPFLSHPQQTADAIIHFIQASEPHDSL